MFVVVGLDARGEGPAAVGVVNLVLRDYFRGLGYWLDYVNDFGVEFSDKDFDLSGIVVVYLGRLKVVGLGRLGTTSGRIQETSLEKSLGHALLRLLLDDDPVRLDLGLGLFGLGDESGFGNRTLGLLEEGRLTLELLELGWFRVGLLLKLLEDLGLFEERSARTKFLEVDAAE